MVTGHGVFIQKKISAGRQLDTVKKKCAGNSVKGKVFDCRVCSMEF